jgi:hypothetical protein
VAAIAAGGTDAPYWSPDGQFLARSRSTTKGSKTTRTIERVPAAGGTPLVLFTGDAAAGKSVAGWSD